MVLPQVAFPVVVASAAVAPCYVRRLRCSAAPAASAGLGAVELPGLPLAVPDDEMTFFIIILTSYTMEAVGIDYNVYYAGPTRFIYIIFMPNDSTCMDCECG